MSTKNTGIIIRLFECELNRLRKVVALIVKSCGSSRMVRVGVSVAFTLEGGLRRLSL